MVLRCSLLGHDYGDPEVEREREERGSEVVVTVREYEECARCGEQNVLSENTEVTSLPPGARSTDAEIDPDTALDEHEQSAERPDSDFDHATPDPGESATGGVGAADPGASESELDPDHPRDEHGEPITDDAEILEDEDDSPGSDSEREHGEWPESDDVGPPIGETNEPAAWPEVETDASSGTGSDTGSASGSETETVADRGPDGEELRFDEASAGGATEATDDAVFVDADSGGAGGYGSAGPGAESEPSGSDSGTGITSAQSAPSPGEGTLPEDVPSEFFCPRCDFVAPGDRGSLRPGDICPDCRRGYLGEREV